MSPDKWRPADGLTLEPNALRAAKESSKTLALTAGPGAGKTEVLAQRADFLLRTGLCPYPQRILAISFKVDASRNLRERVRRRCGAELASRFDSHTFHAFAKRLIDRFRPILTGQDALDPNYVIGPQRITRTSITFEDLVPLAVEILRKGIVARNAVRQTYSHVFLDEFQDCTNTQYSLIKAAFQGTAIQLTAVGDTKQRIMGWAGALEGIFLRYKNDFGALALNLYQNFRSKPRLRRMQNRMVRVLEPAAAVPDKELKGDEGEIQIEHFDDSLAEATAIADWIYNWINEEEVPHSEIAILVSKQPDLYAEVVMAELESRGVPFRNEQKLQDLSAEPIARLIVDFLLVVFGEREPDAFGRLMTVLSFSYQDDDSGDHIKWLQFLDEARKSQPTANINMDEVRALITKFLKELGSPFLRSLSAEYEQGPYLNTKIKDTADRIAELWKHGGNLVQVLSRFSEDRAVRILTIHKSKGLEFHSVILMGVEHQAFFGKIDDERAAFFVGISRAKQRLVLTSVDHRPRPDAATKRWDEKRTAQEEFLGYGQEPE
jgi:superfamily I DNA/RNA helicase